MYLIARIDKVTGAQSDWLVAVSPRADLIEVTTNRQNARRFRSPADAQGVRDRLEMIEPSYKWKVVSA